MTTGLQILRGDPAPPRAPMPRHRASHQKENEKEAEDGEEVCGAEMLEALKKDHAKVITLEDGILDGGFGEKIARFYGPADMKVYNYGLKKAFIDRYSVEEILRENHLTPEQIVQDVL